MSGLRKIGVELRVYQGKMSSFKGLENLESIGGNFWLGSSSSDSFNALVSFKGLGNLKSIGGDFILQSPFDVLESFEGLENLESIGGHFRLSAEAPLHASFAALKSFEGLENLESIGGDFKLAFLKALESLEGLENLQSIGYWHSISIQDCPLLSDFCSLKNAIQNMRGSFKITGNAYNPTPEMILNGQCSKN